MGQRTERHDPGGPPLAPAPRRAPLLATRARVPAAAVLVACTVLTALLGLLFYHQHQPDTLDAAVDNWIGSALSSHTAGTVLEVVVRAGEPAGVAAMTLLLMAVCLATRRLRAAMLVAIAVPVAGGLADLVIKPRVGRIYGLSSLTFPSGHATGVFTLAAVVTVLLLGPQQPRVRAWLRALLVAGAYAASAAVAVTVVALDFHYFTDTIAGAATGTAVVLATAFTLDLLLPRRPVTAWFAGSPPSSLPASDRDLTGPPEIPVRHVDAVTDRTD